MKKIIILLTFIFVTTISVALLSSTKYVEAATVSGSVITIVTDSNRAKVLKTKLASNGDETYNPTDREYSHIAVCCQTGNRIWAAWNAGGANEPSSDMYTVLVYSDDLGETWVDPAIIIDTLGYYDYSPYLFENEDGELYVTWNYGGTCAMIIENPEASMDKIKYRELGKILPRSCSSTPIILKDGTYLAAMEYDMPYFKLYASTDKGVTWTERATLESKASKKYWSEGCVVELEDGRLMFESRIEVGDGHEIFYSEDKGYTWSEAEYYYGKPFVSCGTKGNLIKLSNGNVIWATNNNTSKRVDLTIWISTDNATTWSKGLLLDSSYSEYPTCCELSDGRVFVVWTRERTKCAEIRSAILTQDDIKNATYTTSKTMMLVARGHREYKDIKSTNLPEEIKVDVGTSEEDVLAKLPESIKIIDDYGGRYYIQPSYELKNYDGEIGTYTIKVSIDDETFQDVFNLLQVKLVVAEETSNTDTQTISCVSSVDYQLIIASSIICLFVVVVLKRRENGKV